QVDRAVVVVSGDHRGAGLHRVGGAQDHHAGDRAHEGDVLAALVGSAVLAHREAGVGHGDLDVQVRVADGVADLVEGAARREHCKGGHKGHVAQRAHAAGGGHHVLLGDAAVKVAVGVGVAEPGRAGGFRQVGVKYDQVVGPLPGQFQQGFTVAVAGGDLV